VAAIVVAWNSGERLLAALASAAAGSPPPDWLFVVDNGAGDGSLAAVARDFPAVAILGDGDNRGYSGGNNLAIGPALARGADFVWLLNDDVLVAPDTLATLLAAARVEPRAGLLGPLVCRLEEPERVLSAGGYLRGGWFADHLAAGAPRAAVAPDVAAVDFLSGCALLASRPFVERVGGLDEDYFMYHEDVDWAYRARAAGFLALAVRGALAWHPDTGRRDAESPRVTYYVARNSLLFLRRRRAGRLALARALAGHLRTLLSWTVRPKWRSRRPQRDALALALLDFARGRMGRAAGY
jgi:GT2 family glycosyltransferase